ncbi:MAG: DUF5131 family protein [Clostridia bacterium]|nr:DUF5131 family protein [Clostridia bacterium]
MHDIWNPWHGCIKCSEGCEHCYMYFLDKMRDKNGREIYRTGNFQYPVTKEKSGGYRVKSGEMLRVCMTSDFFLEEADLWRPEAWDIIRSRPDVTFFLLTKRPQRVEKCLPPDWGEGWENVFFNVSCENDRRAKERIPYLLSLPFRHKGIMCAPFIGPVDMEPWLELADGAVEQVVCGGENYDGARVCDFGWVRALYDSCVRHNVTFCFIETGTMFRKDGRLYRIPDKTVQAKMARKSGMQFRGKPMRFVLTDNMGIPIEKEHLYVPRFCRRCEECGSQMICNGCSACGRCGAL